MDDYYFTLHSFEDAGLRQDRWDPRWGRDPSIPVDEPEEPEDTP